jgi:tRNA threonylcarbamoyladenosine biosynthesis protein TsaE
LVSSEATPPARVVETAGPQETEAVAAELAKLLAPGDVVLISGELGAGKTTFVRGAAHALGVTTPVTSPSFAIGNRYDAANAGVSHLDLYRLASLDAEEPDLLVDYINPERIAFVEWPQHAGASGFDRVRVRVLLEHLGGDRRRIAITVLQRPSTHDA